MEGDFFRPLHFLDITNDALTTVDEDADQQWLNYEIPTVISLVKYKADSPRNIRDQQIAA